MSRMDGRPLTRFSKVTICMFVDDALVLLAELSCVVESRDSDFLHCVAIEGLSLYCGGARVQEQLHV